MLGAFTCYMFVVWYGVGYWAALALAIAIVALFGAALDAAILRRVIGQPQFAVVMLTIGLGAIFRSFASITWGSEIYTLPTPFSARATRLGGVTVSHEYVSIIVGTVLLCGALYAFFTFTRVGVAMQAASQNQLAAYYMGIPVKRMFSLIWAISAAVAAIAGVLLAPVSLIDINLGFIGLKAFAAAVLGGFGSIPGALVGGFTIGLIELFAGAYLPARFKAVAPVVVRVGAEAHVYLVDDVGLPWIVSVALASVLTAAVGVLVGLPALRMTGVYLTIATLAFALIIQEVFSRWDRVTGGLKGKPVDKPVLFRVSFAHDVAFYFLCLAFLIGALWLTANLLKAPAGRPRVALRDIRVAAQS